MVEIEDSDDDDDDDGCSDDKGDEEMESEPQPVTPELVIPKLPSTSQAGGLSNAVFTNDPAMSNDIGGAPKPVSNDEMMMETSALNNAADPPKPEASNENIRSPPRPGDGWYVVYRAVLPGVCYGV